MAMLKRKRSFPAQVYDSYRSTSSTFSTDAANDHHQPISVVEENEMPTRKRRRTDSFEKLPSLYLCDWSGSSAQDTTVKYERRAEDQNSVRYSVCALEDHGLQEPLSSGLEVLPPADQQVQTPPAPVHLSPPVSEGNDSQERQRRKSSFGELITLHWSCSSGQGQKVEDQTTAGVTRERHADDETKRTSLITGRKRKRSSHSAQVYDSHQRTTSDIVAENHQPVSVGEDTEMPVRKRRRKSSFKELITLHWSCSSGQGQKVEDQTTAGVSERHAEDDILSRYEIGRLLGMGGFGSVYEGKRLSDGREVAVKFSRKPRNMKYIYIPGHPTPLPLEVGLLMLVNRGPKVPEIIELLDWQDQPDQYIMVLERPSPCQDLWKFRFHGGTISEDTARFIMKQATTAADMCCRRGVFHRDIKLENLLINTETLEVKLIDFGCGDLLQESGYERFGGTRKYRPPEYFTGKYHGEPSTVWSLGVVLFLLVCGHFPKPRDTQMIDDDIWFKPGLSNECCHLIQSLLQENPSRRIELREILQHEWFKE
ncbi:aurora kinase-like [Megalobrama amblycephala]|uniref:aurora kinase-like n=1 Tax=Megalobrama amblycephala TaxID=75352 RepID=UPI0020148162|nr:aurora kinase-like [Megalobrama amblycephala]